MLFIYLLKNVSVGNITSYIFTNSFTTHSQFILSSCNSRVLPSVWSYPTLTLTTSKSSRLSTRKTKEPMQVRWMWKASLFLAGSHFGIRLPSHIVLPFHRCTESTALAKPNEQRGRGEIWRLQALGGRLKGGWTTFASWVWMWVTVIWPCAHEERKEAFF